MMAALSSKRLLWRSAGRHLLRHPWLMALSLLGVALGVAVVVAIDLVNHSAQRSLELANQAVAGRSTHQIVAGPAGVDEALYLQLRIAQGLRDSAPVVEGPVVALDFPGRTFQLLGTDPLADSPLRDYRSELQGERFLRQLMTVPNAVMMAAGTARALGLAVGDSLRVRSAGTLHSLRLVGLMQPQDPLAAQGMADLLLADIATAQSLLDRVGRLSRIDLVLDDGAQLERLRQGLPPGVQLIDRQGADQAQTQMTAAFRTNLTAMSLLALLVGGFIIFNTMSFSVLQRRRLFGLQRALGVTAAQLWQVVLGEALVVGLLGAGLGLLLGVVLAEGLLGLVTRTINDLYYTLELRALHISYWGLGKGLLLGVGATVLASLVPTWEATHTPARATLTRSYLEARTRRAVRRLAWVGLLAILCGAILLAYSGTGLGPAFVGLFALVIGYALLTPRLVMGAIHVAAALWPRGRALLGRMALLGVVNALSRTGVALAALLVAVATMVGVSTMVHSFRGSVVDWIEHSLRADIYLSVAEAPDLRRHGLSRDLVDAIRRLPGVTALSLGRGVEVPVGARRQAIVALDLPPQGFAGYQWLQAVARPYAAFQSGMTVLVSEPYAYRHGVALGDTLSLPTAQGERSFRVIGIYRDYGAEHGRITLRRELYERLWQDPVISTIGVYLQESADVAHIMDRVRALLPAQAPLRLRANAEIRAATLQVFDRTFAITDVLRLLTLLVAFVGILTALMALQLERARELAVLRAIGLTPRQLWLLVSGETGLMGLLAGLLALPLGLVLAWVLIHVINRRAFGWGMPMDVDFMQLASALGFAVLAALLAGLYPAWRMARTSPALALRGE
jgi:putative ABC transport system permease protein